MVLGAKWEGGSLVEARKLAFFVFRGTGLQSATKDRLDT